MINNAADPSEGYISPCVIEEVTVKTEFDESVVNIRAQLLISPYANINLGLSFGAVWTAISSTNLQMLTFVAIAAAVAIQWWTRDAQLVPR